MRQQRTPNFKIVTFYKTNPRQEIISACDTLDEAQNVAKDVDVDRVHLFAQTDYGKRIVKDFDYLSLKGENVAGVIEAKDQE